MAEQKPQQQKPQQFVQPGVKARKSRKPIDPNETKEAKTIRLANKRVPACVKRIRSVKNLAHPSQYALTEKQRVYIVNTLVKEINLLVDAMKGTKPAAETFALPTD